MKNTLRFLLVLFLTLQSLIIQAQSRFSPSFINDRNMMIIDEFSVMQKYYENGDLTTFEFMLDSLLRIYDNNNEFDKYLLAKNLKAEIYYFNKDFKTAYNLFWNVKEYYQAKGDTINTEYAYSLFMIGLLSKWALDDYVSIAYEYKTRTIAILERIGVMNKFLGTAYAVLKGYFIDIGDIDNFVKYYLKCKKIAEYFKSDAGIIYDLDVYYLFGEYESDFKLKFSKYAVYKFGLNKEKFIDNGLYQLALDYYGENLIEAGQYKQALSILLEADSLLQNRKIFNKALYSLIPLAITRAYGYLGNSDNFYSYYNKALNEYKKVPVNFRDPLIHYYNSAAKACMAFNLDSALTIVENSITDTSVSDLQIDSYRIKAEILYKQGNVLEAINNLTYGIYTANLGQKPIKQPNAETPKIPVDSSLHFNKDLYTDLAIYFWSLYNEDGNPIWLLQGISASLKADTAMWKWSSRLTTPNAFLGYAKKVEKNAELGLAILNEYSNITDKNINKPVAHFIKSAKGLAILNEIKLQQIEVASLSDTLIYNNLMLKEKQIRYFTNLLLSNKNAPIDSVNKWYINQMDAELARLCYRYLIYQSDKKKIQVDLSNQYELTSLVKKDEALIEYFVTDTCFYTLCTTANNVFFNKRSVDLKALIMKLVYAIKTNYPLKDDISNILLSDIAQLIQNKKRLIIIPDKSLAAFPFEILKLDNKMLVEDHALCYNYASELWSSSGNNITQNKHPSLVAIAPGFGSESQDYAYRNMVFTDADTNLLEGIYRDDYSLVPLKKSITEVKLIDSIFLQNGCMSDILINESANEKNAIQMMRNKSIIHFATHGLSSNNIVEKSGLFLTKTKNQPFNISNDGFLSYSEIYNLQLKSDLVVLSACKTGTGRIVEGEGVMALPRGFIYAGVPNVIASLWKVHDEKTKDLMVAFYKHLLEDKVSYAEALQLAKLDCIEKGFLPIDWAGFVLIGN